MKHNFASFHRKMKTRREGKEGRKQVMIFNNIATNVNGANFFIALLSPTTNYILFMKFY